MTLRPQNSARACYGAATAVVIGLSLYAPAAFGGIADLWRYLQRYQFGVDYTNSNDSVDVSYEVPASQSSGDAVCEPVIGDISTKRCSAYVGAGFSSGYGFLLQQSFKRQGDIYVNFDVGFGARRLVGAYPPASQKVGSTASLQSVNFELLALVARPYLQVGLTPAHTWPDILLSIGPAFQAAYGRVKVNAEGKNVLIGTSSGLSNSGLIGGYTELEIVFWRFGEGAFSIYTARDFTSGASGTPFYPGEVDGMEKIRANFARGVGGAAFGFGLKLVMDWP